LAVSSAAITQVPACWNVTVSAEIVQATAAVPKPVVVVGSTENVIALPEPLALTV
jgi:hypothetical protein